MKRPDSTESDATAYGIRAVERVCDIIELLGSSDEPIALPELAKASGLPKSSVFRYLSTLETRRFVERVGETTGYRLGTGILALRGRRAEDLVPKIEPLLRELRDEFMETANLGFLDGNQVAYLRILESPRTVRLAARPSDRDELHCTALGKVLLADMSDEAVIALIGTSYLPRTPATITSWAMLRTELARVREQGYALDDEENESGGRCVAVRVPNTAAAVSISAPASRLPDSALPHVVTRLQELVMGVTIFA